MDNLQQIHGSNSTQSPSTGLELVNAFNANFEKVKNEIESLDQRLFYEVQITSMQELNVLQSGTYKIYFTQNSKTEEFYLLCSVDPETSAVTQTKISDKISSRKYEESAWSEWGSSDTEVQTLKTSLNSINADVAHLYKTRTEINISVEAPTSGKKADGSDGGDLYDLSLAVSVLPGLLAQVGGGGVDFKKGDILSFDNTLSIFEKWEFLGGTLIVSNFVNRALEQKKTQDKISVVQRGNISGGGKWANLNTNNTYKHLLIDIAEYAGQTITCTRTGTYKYYAFLTSDNRVNNVVPSFVSDTSRVSGDANAVTIPATATLFYTSIADEDGEINLPTIKIGSVEIDYNKSIEGEILKINKAIEGVKDIDLTQIAADVATAKTDAATATAGVNIVSNRLAGSVSIININVTNDDVVDGNITSAGKWANVTDPVTPYKCVLIPVGDYKAMKLTWSRSGYGKYYAFLTSIEGRNNNVNAALCDGCSRVSGAAIDVAIPNDANYLFIAVSDSDGVVYLPSVSIDTLQEDAPSYEQIRASVKIKSVPSVKKIPFTVSVNINTAIDESDTTSLADTAVMSDDYCVLDLPDNYSLDEPCKLVMYLHGAGGSINAAGTGEGTNLTDYLLTFGYAVLRVNGLPSGFYEEGMRIGGSFGIPVACDCHYKAYLYVVNNYNIDKNGCYIIGQSMGGVVGCNLVQNYNIPVRAIAFDAPLFSMYNAWFAPPWGQTGNDAKSVRYLLAKGFNFDFTEVNTAYNKSYTLATFPFDTAHSEYSSAMTTALWNSNKNKLNGYDPYTCNVFTIADKDYKIFKYPFKAWRGEQDSPDSRLPYCKHFVEMVNNAGGLAYARYPDVSFHGLVSATAAAGLEMITENGVTVPCVTKEIRLFLERY